MAYRSSRGQSARGKKINTSRGFGYVRFSSVEEATIAVEAMHGKEIMSKIVTVEFALSKEQQTMQQSMQNSVRLTASLFTSYIITVLLLFSCQQ